MTRQAGDFLIDALTPPAPKRRWVFVHGNDPIVIDEQEVRGSCFFRDYVMGKLECRRLDPNATATESNADLTTTIDRLRELRDRKSARIAEINANLERSLALEWVRLRLETEVRFCNDQIVRLSRGLPIDQEPHEIAKQAWSERERVARAGGRAETLRDQLAYACHQLARIAGAIDETGKAAEALMTGWGEENGRAGEDAARHVTDEALDVMSRATDLAKASNRFGIARSRCIVEGLAFELAFEFTDALDALQTAAVASYEANLKRSREK